MKNTIVIYATLILFAIAFTACSSATPPDNNKEDDVNAPSGVTDTSSITGTWYYIKSTEGSGDNERLLSPQEVEILREFQVSPPRLEIKEDNTIFADFSAFEVRAELTQTDTFSFDIITDESKNQNEAAPDFIVFDPASELLRYTWNLADINHYFSREMPTTLPPPPVPDIPGVTWLVPPTFAYEAVLHCPLHGFLAYGGYWIDEKTGEETGESCGHGVGWTDFLYDAQEDRFGANTRNETDWSFDFYSKEEFETEFYDFMNNVNPYSGIDSTKVRLVPVYADDGKYVLYNEYEIDDGAFSGKTAVAYGCDFVTEFIYDEYERWRRPNDIIAVAIDGKWGILNKEGNIAAPFVFDHAISIDNTTAFAKYEGLYGIISLY